MTPIKRYRDTAIVVVLLALPFFFLHSNMKNLGEANALDRLLLRVSSPVEFAAATLARGLTNLWGDYIYLVDVKADNARLAYDNARLRENLRKVEQEQVDNRELRRLLQLRDSLPAESVAAQVKGRDTLGFFRIAQLTLDRGQHSIRARMPVVSPDGVVGTVLKVSGDSVFVQLSVDAAFAIDVEDERTHARGFARGTGDPSRYSSKIEMVDSRDEIEVGDLLVTSGKGNWFPKGIPVARVSKVTKLEVGRDQEVEAVPMVNFSRLDTVLVLVTPPSEETAVAPAGKTGTKGK